MSDLKPVLMKRDEITSDEADDLINAVKDELSASTISVWKRIKRMDLMY
jgi:hypothetical protein